MYGAYHQGFNTGVNQSEAINFATPEWIPYFELSELCSCGLVECILFNFKFQYWHLIYFLFNFVDTQMDQDFCEIA